MEKIDKIENQKCKDNFEEIIENFKKVTKEDVISVSKKINIYSTYTLEGVKQDEEN